MFPYYWNGFYDSAASPFAANVAVVLRNNRVSDDDLPEEVREALENHKDNFYSAGEREEFIRRQYLKK